ncbi:hypothetical protein ACQ856_28865 (plasmid) [Mycolicibacterium psychrotolerans]|uniref:hypothetical protein n=1 Tax=Mycolicibacterium psychrotolerans TaxID=216929 RepID=UPI003D67877E
MAQQMFNMLTAAKAAGQEPSGSRIGTASTADVSRPHGLFTETLIGGVWPTESESSLRDLAERLLALGHEHGAAATSALAKTDEVFDGFWTDGSGAESAESHYRNEYVLHSRLSEALTTGGAGFARLGDSVGRIKTKMRDAHDDAHREIEDKLRTNMGEPVIFSEILPRYRTLIHQYSTELTGFVDDEIKTFVNTIPLPQSPATGQGEGEDGHRRKSAPSGEKPADGDPESQVPQQGNRDKPTPGQAPGVPAGLGIPGTDAPMGGRRIPFRVPSGESKPSLPSLPSLPSAGGGVARH